MILSELIARLEKAPQDLVCKDGFSDPHSYRGNYDELAFEPAPNVKVSDMLKSARSALGTTYSGWKGGYYTMFEDTTCYLANEGDCGEELTEYALNWMLLDSSTPDQEVYSEKFLRTVLRQLKDCDDARLHGDTIKTLQDALGPDMRDVSCPACKTIYTINSDISAVPCSNSHCAVVGFKVERESHG